MIWSDFGQYYRPHWRYDLGPFTFNRTLYEAELMYLRGFPERYLPYFEHIARQEPDYPQWRNGAELCRRWLALLDDTPTQEDVDQFIATLKAEPVPGSAWADIHNQFVNWALIVGFRV